MNFKALLYLIFFAINLIAKILRHIILHNHIHSPIAKATYISTVYTILHTL